MIVYRHASPRLPFLWESGTDQPAGRWHGRGEGPAQYFADTPDGAWAEFLRREHITDPADLDGVRETLWAVELPDDIALAEPALDRATLTGGPETYAPCREEAARLRARGTEGLVAPSAALIHGGAHGWRDEGGTLRPGPSRDGRVVVLFGARPDLVGWRACAEGRPDPDLVERVRRVG